MGLHFYLEGQTKLKDKKPFSGPFFANAKGPLAPLYRRMVWDADGYWRLNRDATTKYWDQYNARVASHYGFDDKQKKAADKVIKDYKAGLNYYLGSKKEDIETYYKELDRRDANRQNSSRQALTSLQAHDARIDNERNSLKGPILAGIDKIWKDLEEDLNAVATEKQAQRSGILPIGKIGRQPFDSEFHDATIPYIHIAIGVLLIIGLFTRVAAIGAALFLASVCAAQWPGYGGVPIYYQLIEMLACLALAAIGAGQFYGLDYVLTGLWKMSKQKDTPASKTGSKTTTSTNQPASVLVPSKGK